MISFQDYLDFVKNNRIRQPLVKFEMLRKEDETPLREITSKLRLEGSLNISNGNGVRRTLDISFDNTLNEFFPSLDSGIWVAQKGRLSLGYLINGEEYFIKQGTFVYDKPVVNPDNSVKVSMQDKFSLLNGSLAGKIDFTLVIPSSTTLGTAIRTVMSISQDPRDVIIDTTIDSENIPYQIVKEEGSNLGEILIELAQAFSCNVYYNTGGSLVFEKDSKDSSKGSIWDFDADSEDETNYVSGNTQYNLDEVVNSITVIGDNISGVTVRKNVQNNDLLSDTSIGNLGIEILEIVKDSIIYSVALCEQRGIYELKRKTNVLTQGNITSMILPHLDVDHVVTATDSRQDANGKRILLDRITMPLTNSPMSLTVVDTFDIDL
jgi:hypothetical protein